MKPSTFEAELQELINKHAKDSDSATPDFVLARYLLSCLEAFDQAVTRRDEWYGKHEAAELTAEAPNTKGQAAGGPQKTGFLLKLEEIRNRLKAGRHK